MLFVFDDGYRIHRQVAMPARLLYIAVLVLVPIIPAYLLFRALPSEATASGPFKGLSIKLGGAFAGYFLVLLAIAYLVPFVDYGPQDYTFRGKVALGIDSTADPRIWGTYAAISVKPTRSTIQEDGQLIVHLPYDAAISEPPFIHLDAQRCGSVVIPIDRKSGPANFGAENYDLHFDIPSHLIVAHRPIIIRPYPFASAAQRDTLRVLCGAGVQ
jgi:hypothetical protein